VRTKVKDFTAICRANDQLIKSCAEQFESDPERRADLVQEIWLEAWRTYESFENKSSIKTWLWAVGENVGKKYLRDRVERQPELVMDSQLTPAQSEDDDDPIVGSWIEQSIESPYDTVEEAEMLDALVFAGGTFSEQETAVFNLVYWHGHSYDSVARRFGISRDSLGPIVGRLRSKLERGLRPLTSAIRYYPPGNVWGDWSWKPEGLGNVRMGLA
jgi:RNA polymerase sigma factor (sigma-70 family)